MCIVYIFVCRCVAILVWCGKLPSPFCLQRWTCAAVTHVNTRASVYRAMVPSHATVPPATQEYSVKMVGHVMQVQHKMMNK